MAAFGMGGIAILYACQIHSASFDKIDERMGKKKSNEDHRGFQLLPKRVGRGRA